MAILPEEVDMQNAIGNGYITGRGRHADRIGNGYITGRGRHADPYW